MTRERKGDMELIGHVDVDAGMVMVGDPCYLDRFELQDKNDFDQAEPYPFSYDGAAAATLSERKAGVLGEGSAVAVATGYGDGTYPVYVTYNEEGRVTSLTVVFDDPDATEDEVEQEGHECAGGCGSMLDAWDDEECEPCREDREEFELAEWAMENGEDPG